MRPCGVCKVVWKPVLSSDRLPEVICVQYGTWRCLKALVAFGGPLSAWCHMEALCDSYKFSDTRLQCAEVS